jgi:hypothetical protein
MGQPSSFWACPLLGVQLVTNAGSLLGDEMERVVICGICLCLPPPYVSLIPGGLGLRQQCRVLEKMLISEPC